MTAARPGAGQTSRLADQLQRFSEVVETLAYRLIELEERLESQERRLQSLLETGASPDPAGAVKEGMDLRLAETEERISRIEAALDAGRPQAAGTRLRPMPHPAALPVEPAPASGDSGLPD